MSDAEGLDATARSQGRETPAPAPRRLGPHLRTPLMVALPLLILAVVAFFILTGGKSEATDNAYIQAARTPISASISARVVAIEVRENQAVRKGQVLFRLEDADYRVAVAQAQAMLAAARFEAQGAKAVYGQTQADLAVAQESAAYARREAARQKALAAAGVATRAKADEAAHAAEEANRNIAVVRQQIASALAGIGGGANVAVDAQPKVMQALAMLERARLDLSYCTVVAPTDGVVAKVEQLQIGSRVTPSQTLFWLISGKPWIEANFKENQLAHMRIGQPATVKVDAYDRKLKAHVASFSPGAGSTFSLLPPENATGNWVKVVQRVPVRLDLDETAPNLGSGLSAKVTVDVRSASRR